MSKTYIGLVGTMASGKGEVAKILQKRGFKVFSLSRVVRDEVAKKNIKVTRALLQDTGDSLRKRFGLAVLAKRTLAKVRKSGAQKIVVDAIRNPAEVKYLKSKVDIKIVGVDANLKSRFRNLKARNYPYDPKTLKGFREAERRDRGVGQDKYGQQVSKTLGLADLVIKNNHTIKDLQKKVLDLIKQ